MGEARSEDRKSEGFYQPDVRKRIKFSITKDNISKIQISLCIVENNISKRDRIRLVVLVLYITVTYGHVKSRRFPACLFN